MKFQKWTKNAILLFCMLVALFIEMFCVFVLIAPPINDSHLTTTYGRWINNASEEESSELKHALRHNKTKNSIILIMFAIMAIGNMILIIRIVYAIKNLNRWGKGGSWQMSKI